MNGRPLSTSWLDDHVLAIVEAGYLGMQMGPAVAEVIFGDYNPGGRLPISVPRTVGQVPIFYNHTPTGRPPNPADPFTSKYLDTPSTPLYPFGHGLSYTTFVYDSLRLSASRAPVSDSIIVRVRVRNSGSRAGDEVVQLYLRDEAASFTRPVQALRGFQRITLAPGVARTLSFTIGPADYMLPGPDLRPIVEPGFFTVGVGTSSARLEHARLELVP